MELIWLLWPIVGVAMAAFAKYNWNRRWSKVILQFPDGGFECPLPVWLGIFLGPLLVGCVIAELVMKDMD